jgi:2-phosphosulfolactate phosphatase
MRVSAELVARSAGQAVERGDVVVVIDILRCTSSIITALFNGATRVLPVRTVTEARSIYKENPLYILAGERRGLKPKGFTLGNSPRAFTRDRVDGKTIVMTTTSGTLALSNVRESPWVLIGALLNAKYVAEAAFKLSAKESRGISLVLAGSRGRFSLEDFLGAGAVIDGLPQASMDCSDAAYAAFLAFTSAKDSLSTTLQGSVHGKTLQRLGLGEDVVFCSHLNQYRMVPQLRDNAVVPLDDD